jgi:hypothetical protein
MENEGRSGMRSRRAASTDDFPELEAPSITITRGVSSTRMVDAVQDWNLTERVEVYALDVGDVDPVLPRVGPSTVVCVDTANRAEVVLGLVGVEGVKAELVGTTYHLEAVNEDGCDDGSLSPADRAVAAAEFLQPIRHVQAQLDRAAVTRRSFPRHRWMIPRWTSALRRGCAVPGCVRRPWSARCSP